MSSTTNEQMKSGFGHPNKRSQMQGKSQIIKKNILK